VVTRSDAPFTAPAAIAGAWLGAAPLRVEPLPGGGLSGAPVVLVRPERGAACVLKRVGRDAAAAPRATWVHALVARARDRGVVELPPPLATPGGATLVADSGGGLWELVPFVTGASVASTDARHLRAALEVLARLHTAWYDAPAGPADRVGGPAAAPAVLRRSRQAAALARDPWPARRAAAVAPTHGAAPDGLVAAVVSRWDRAIALLAAGAGRRAVARIAAVAAPALTLQPVVRDVWYDHVLFEPGVPAAGPRVAALIDLHGAAIDTPATDVARLAGSWWSTALGPRCEAWLAEAVEAYAATRPLAAAERALVPWLHAAGVVCALDNWFRWIVEEGCVFADAARVLARIDRLLDALPWALEWLTERGLDRV
jgi:Ser/Thr protein kinase RdoA (MazF antagonist)